MNSLDSQLQAELAAEAEANAALQAGINASTAEKATVSNDTAGTTENTNNGDGNTPAPAPAPAPTPQPSTPAPAPTPSAPSQSVDGGTVVSRAYSKLGCAYSWGGIGPNSFDCSGFVSYCLTGRYCRLGTTGTFMGWTRVSDPQPGDVVVNSYHTGIYIGNGQMIHASDYKHGRYHQLRCRRHEQQLHFRSLLSVLTTANEQWASDPLGHEVHSFMLDRLFCV